MSAMVACEHAPACPGCPEIGREPAAQREDKRARVQQALSRFESLAEIARRAEAVPDVGPIAGYRTRAKLMVGGARRGAHPRLGLYREGTHDVLDLPGCVVLAPALAEAAAALRALLREPPPEAEGALVASADGGALEAIDLREIRSDGDARAMATLVVDAIRAPSEAAAHAAATAVRRACPGVVSVAINLRGRGPQVLGAETHVLLGPAELPDRIEGGAPYVLAAHGSFVQAHRGAAAAIHAEVERELAPLGAAPRVVELFAGSGALALRLAARGARVHAIESFAPAIERARRAAEAQRIPGLSIEASDACAALARMARAGERADAIVLDPPRRGIEPALRAAIAQLAPSRVLYVSCDPDTLARDLAHLARLGLAATRVAPFDLMPQTAHVETLAVLAPAPPPPLRILHEGERLIAIDQGPHTAAADALASVRALPGAANARPVLPLDDDTSGIALFARRPEHAAALEAALRVARVGWVALARGITRAEAIAPRRARPRGGAPERDATTRFVRRAIVGGHSLLRVSPEDGAPVHAAAAGSTEAQIRRHLAAIGHPVLGDARDGHAASNRHLWERAALDRTFLHVERIEIALEGAPPRVLYARLAPDLALVLERLRARGDAPPRA